MLFLSHSCFYKQGNFFILYGGYGSHRFTLSLGPDRFVLLCVVDPRYVFLAFWTFCVVMIIISTKYSELSSKSPLYQGVFYSLSFIAALSYLYTGICDAGVITPNEDNAIENADQLEKLSYSYCTICKLFRPPKAAHCPRCGVCFRNMDHHCLYMG